MSNLESKVAVITGASSGIGRATALVRATGSLLVVVSLVLLGAAPAGAEPGDLDSTFGDGGAAVVHAGGEQGFSEGWAVAVDPTGAIVVAGVSGRSAGEGQPIVFSLVVSRLGSDGEPDTAFGEVGVAAIDLGGFVGVAAVAVQPDRRVVVLASSESFDESGMSESHLYVVRLTSQGALDPSFGSSGKSELLPAGRTSGRALVTGSDGTLLVGGGIWRAGFEVPSPMVARLTPAGQADPAFGDDGVAILDGSGTVDAIGVGPDGRVVAAVADGGVHHWPGMPGSLTIRRLSADGRADLTFANGAAELPLPPALIARSVLPGTDGSVVVVGAIGRNPLVAKLTPSGSLDPTFGHDGVVELAVLGGVYDVEITGTLLPDGKILVGGPGGPTHTFMVRLLASGRPDRSFGPGGRVSIPIPFQVQTGPAVQGDGRAVFAGVTHDPVPGPEPGLIEQIGVARADTGNVPDIAPADLAQRLAGADRVATAIAASQATFSAWMEPEPDRIGASNGVVLVSADSFADAVVATPFAATAHLPLLLTPSTALDPRVLAEMRRVAGDGSTGPMAYVVGGTAAVSDDVVQAVKDAGYEVARIAGANRYETATELAMSYGGTGAVLEVSGRDFADAVVAGAAATHLSGVVVFTAGTVQSAETAAFLAGNDVVRYAVGGPAATADPGAIPIVGADRYDTAAKVAASFFPTPSYVALASGTRYADALVGSARAAFLGAPLLLTGAADLPAPADAWLRSASSWIDGAEVIGGTAAVEGNVVAAVTNAIHG